MSLEDRVAALEAEIITLREQVSTLQPALRLTANLAEFRRELHAQTRLISALRETQLEQGIRITEHPVEPQPGSATVDQLDLTTVGTVAQLAAALRQLRASVGAPTLRALAAQAALEGFKAAHTTLGNAESGKHLPRRDVVEAFVQGCGVDRRHLPQWREAWQRAYQNRQQERMKSSVEKSDHVTAPEVSSSPLPACSPR